MVSILVFRPSPVVHEDYEVLAEATVRDGHLETSGRRPDLVATDRPVYSARRQRLVVWDEDPDEWLRSFAEAFRTAHVGALIVHDSAHRELEAPPETVAQLGLDARITV